MMKNILTRQNRLVLEQFASSNVLIAFDYDGTLAPIVDDREAAYMRPATRERLATLARRYPCIVICGRAQDDALRRLRGVGLREVIGNHGLEPWHANDRMFARTQQWAARLELALAGYKGVSIENKLFSIAIHYRQSREKKRAHAAILAAVATLEEARTIAGKQVVNVLPQHAPHKGIALERACDRLGCDTAIFVGDDASDEDVFALDRPGRLLTVHVGPSTTSMANACIRDQHEIDDLIDVLIELRAASVHGPSELEEDDAPLGVSA